MRLIKPSFEILEQAPGIEGMFKHIELCGRVAYKSEDKITEESAPKFVDMITKRNHTAVLEHGTIYLTMSVLMIHKWSVFLFNEYSDVRFYGLNVYITTNLRVIHEAQLSGSYAKYFTDWTPLHVKRISVKFLIDRGVSHEFVRHRKKFSFVQESTRFCNYSKEQFGNELTYIIPCWTKYIDEGEAFYYDGICFRSGYIAPGQPCRSWTKPKEGENEHDWKMELRWLRSVDRTQDDYLDLLEGGWVPQQARSVLPNSLKTELIMTATIEQWEGFFKLRCAKDAHPSAREVAIPLEEKFKELGYE